MPRTVLLWLLAVLALALVLVRPRLGAGQRPAAATAPVRIASPVSRELLVVDVTGEVRRPGVYRLRDGARVHEALRRAGGMTAGADPSSVNRAAKVADGQQIRVPSRIAPSAATTAGAGAAAGPVSLNAATAEQLDELDGVGPATAHKIVDWRTANGGFSSVDDLAQVPGIGPKRMEALRPQVAP